MNNKFEDIKIRKKRVKTITENVIVKNQDIIKNITEDSLLGNDLQKKVEFQENNRLSNIDSNKYNSISKYSDKYDFLNKRRKVNNQRISSTPIDVNKSKKFNKKILFIFILSMLIGFYYLLSTSFLSAKVMITHKSEAFELKDFLVNATKGDNGTVPFELMIINDTFKKDVFLSSLLETNEKAKGEITIYNEYGTKSQKITAGAFIKDENGKSYKIDKTVTVPGYKKINNKIIPGQIDVTITSFLPGDIYNGTPEVFYFDMFNKTDKYKKITAKIKSELKGGSVGMVYILDEEEKSKIKENLTQLKENLNNKLNAQIPNGYVLFPSAIDIEYIFPENFISKNSNASIEVNGNIKAFIIKENKLSNFVIKKIIKDINETELTKIKNIDFSNLEFIFSDSNLDIDKDVSKFEFKLNGNITLEWIPNENIIKEYLAGRKIYEVSKLFEKDTTISHADVVIFPPWSKNITSNLDKININIK